MPDRRYTAEQVDAAVGGARRPRALRPRAGDRHPRRARAAARPQRGAGRGRLVRRRARGRDRPRRADRGAATSALRAVRTLVAEEARLGMLVGVAVGLELARRAVARPHDQGDDRPHEHPLPRPRRLRARARRHDGADRPVPDRQPEGRRQGRRGRGRRDPAHPRPRRPHRRHRRHRQAHRRPGRRDRRARRRDRRGGRRHRLRPQHRRHRRVRLGLGPPDVPPGTPRRRRRAPSTPRPASWSSSAASDLPPGRHGLFSDLALPASAAASTSR